MINQKLRSKEYTIGFTAVILYTIIFYYLYIIIISPGHCILGIHIFGMKFTVAKIIIKKEKKRKKKHKI